MSLLMLSNVEDNEWYIPTSCYPHGKRGYITKKYSPREKIARKCKELAFYTVEIQAIQKHSIRSSISMEYFYKQMIDILLQKNPSEILRKMCIKRVRTFA